MAATCCRARRWGPSATIRSATCRALCRDHEPLRLRLCDTRQPRFQLRHGLSRLAISERSARPVRVSKMCARNNGRARALPGARPHARKRPSRRYRRHRDGLCEHLGAAGASRRHHASPTRSRRRLRRSKSSEAIRTSTLCVYHGGFERDLATGRVLSATHENVAYRICQELDFDILLTGHQHMSVPGQTLFGTFVVQPSDRGQEFIRDRSRYVSGRRKAHSRARPSLRTARAAANGCEEFSRDGARRAELAR